MTARLATEDGITAYRRRSHIGETFHGDLKHNQQFRRLSVRGLPRASGEWTFAAAVRNLRKAITSGHLHPAGPRRPPRLAPAGARPAPPGRRRGATAGRHPAHHTHARQPPQPPHDPRPAQDDSGTAP